MNGVFYMPITLIEDEPLVINYNDLKIDCPAFDGSGGRVTYHIRTTLKFEDLTSRRFFKGPAAVYAFILRNGHNTGECTKRGC